MGILRRQSIFSALYTYIGIVLGAVTVMLLMPKYLTEAEMGVVEVTNKLAMLCSMVGAVGLPHALIRFMPRLPKQETRLIAFATKVLLLAAACITLLVVGGYGWASQLYAHSPLFLEYYFWIPLFIVSLLLFSFFESILISQLDTLWPTFLRDILLRGLTLCGLIGVGLGLYSFQYFYVLYAFGHLTILMIIWLRAQTHITRLRQAKAPGSSSAIPTKAIWKYAISTIVSTASIYMVFVLDSLMISSILGIAAVASYAVYYNMSVVVQVPSRAIIKTSTPLLAQAWAKEDSPALNAIYTKTSLIGLWVSGLIFVCILQAEPWIKGLYIHLGKPAFAQDFPLFELLGLTAVINAAFGNNHYILHSSPKYRWDLYMNILLLAIGFLGNLWFISLWGAWGAALASLLAMLLINLLKSGLLWHFFRLQPFSWRQGAVLALLAVAWLVASHVPQLNLWLWVPVRCLVAALIVVVPTLYWRLVPSLNAFAGVVQQRLRR